MLRSTIAAALVALSVAAPLPAFADPFPSRPVHLIVAYSPGGTGDVVARVIADKLGGALGQSTVVENRAGASGAIGAQAVLNSTPDGHTLLLGQTAEIAVNQYWIKGLTYDPANLMPVALATVVPLALAVPASAPYSTLADMLKTLASSDKKFSFASAGTGTPGHIAGEYLSAKLPGRLVHVPYKGAGPALNDLIGNHVDMYFPGFPAAMPLVKAGTLKVLAVSSAQRSQAAPEIPTVAEVTGIGDFDLTLWQGFFAPLLEHWHEFYLLIGTAAAALVALLFVAASVGAGLLSHHADGPTRTYVSPIAFHFTSAFFVSAAALVPSHTRLTLGAMVGLNAVAGMIYAAFVLRRLFTDDISDLADRVCYGILPLADSAAVLWRAPLA